MTWLAVGLIIFFAGHALPAMPGVKTGLVTHLGRAGYGILFGVFALAGLGLVVYGKATAGYVPLWPDPLWMRPVAKALMPVAFVLVAADLVTANFSRIRPRPSFWGIGLWAALHLAANGDLASVLLFGGFILYAALGMLGAHRRGYTFTGARQPFWRDGLVIILGIVAYGVVLHAHGVLFGRDLTG